MTVEFFAEIGSNASTIKGNYFYRAMKLIDAAAEIGCAGVKFQYFKANDLWHPSRVKELAAAEKVEIPFHWIPGLSLHARKKGLLFGLSVFDKESVQEVKQYVDYFKIASFEIGLFKLIRKCYSAKKRLMLSIGQTDKVELNQIIRNLPDRSTAMHIDILHCVSQYPTKPEDCNLAILKTNPVINGWSDHTVEPMVIYSAIACGAKVIEFHLDLDDGMGIEAGHSWNPLVISRVMKFAETLESSLGSNDWDEVAKLQDRKYKADPETGLRGK